MNRFLPVFLFGYRRLMKSWAVWLWTAVTVLGAVGGALAFGRDTSAGLIGQAAASNASFLVSVYLLIAVLLCGKLVIDHVAKEKAAGLADMMTVHAPPFLLIGGKVVALLAVFVQQLAAAAIMLAVLRLIPVAEVPQLFRRLGQAGLSGARPWEIGAGLLIGLAVYVLLYAVVGCLPAASRRLSIAHLSGALVAIASCAASLYCERDPQGPVSMASRYIPVFYPFVLPMRVMEHLDGGREWLSGVVAVLIYGVIGTLLLRKWYMTHERIRTSDVKQAPHG